MRRYSIWPRSPSRPMGPVSGSLVGRFQHFAVARAMGRVALHRDDQLVPILRFVVLEILVRTGERIVAALELAAAQEYAAVGVGRSAKFQLEREVFGKVTSRIELLDAAAFCRRGDDKPAIQCNKTSVGGRGLAVEVDRRFRRSARAACWDRSRANS